MIWVIGVSLLSQLVRRAYTEPWLGSQIRDRYSRCRMSLRCGIGRHVVGDPRRARGELVVDRAGAVIVVGRRPANDGPAAVEGDRVHRVVERVDRARATM